MTRFDADTSAERRKLFADAVTAHRERGSAFLTVEVEPHREELRFGESGGDADGDADADRDGDSERGVGDAAGDSDRDDDGDDAESPPPWIQFAEKTFNLDCTDEELARLHDLLEEYPEFRVDERETPEDADGTNVRISARSDANRLAGFLDRAFAEVYDQPDDYRAWVVQI
ncbi:hypothetical protein Hbl1158_06160 [Halobaculum sp. CBA1158]|uniref:hypothetical protein n=1 Tax=Halobaculum sp. CBA1158 TaxID=2904243 RepID=UPI001F3C6944|nr:hypothetical protein [Halobaculum sp. CBA1158]UIP00939.1 hypothetical protein Hbl1158_06160 [Halobaculum sp. CBA1158]